MDITSQESGGSSGEQAVRAQYMSVDQLALLHQAQTDYYRSYVGLSPDYDAPPPPYKDWSTSDVSSSTTVTHMPSQDGCSASSAASSVSSGSTKSGGRKRNDALRGRRKKRAPMYIPGTSRLFSSGSKNHKQGMCRPCFLNSSSTPCPAGVSCNFCHYEHDSAKLVESEAYSLRKKAERDRAAQAASPAVVYPNPENYVPSSSTTWPAGTVAKLPSPCTRAGSLSGTLISL
eukprot:TRINITY_DN13263_c0_g1_i1.p1 TRINITY_DN13263_c0_g1~~TRINITY_DN13263_c0_g1_i1.p1  ORF type:complete len:231 (+),score=25.54 TRINITY_DN13263_c0_g1_i1:76-768(+)